MSRRQERLVSLLQKLVSEYFLKLDFEKHIVTITRTEISDDLKTAKIFVSIYPEGTEEKILKIIKAETPKIKKEVVSKIKMRFTPKLEFEKDVGEKNRQRIEELLKM